MSQPLDTLGSSQELRSALLKLLVERSFARREVLLASGATSDWFVDCKQAALSAQGHRLVAAVLMHEIEAAGVQLDAVAGVALGGCSLASAVSYRSVDSASPLDAFYVRKSVKDHGSARHIEGDDRFAGGADVVVVEDVVTSGGSTLKAVQELRSHGHRVKLVVALVDRQAGGAQALAADGLEFRAVYVRNDFFAAHEAVDTQVSRVQARK